MHGLRFANRASRMVARRWVSYVPVEMPKLSPTMEKGVIVEWKVKVGDFVESDTHVAEVQTDKATIAFKYMGDEGYLAKILTGESEEAALGQEIAVLVEDEADIAKGADYTPSGAAPEAAPAAADPAPAAAAPAPAAAAPKAASVVKSGRVAASPLAASIASTAGIDLEGVKATGPGGRILAQDVIQAIKGTSGGAGAAAAFTDTPTSQMRRSIASRLLESKNTIPHFYLTADVSVDKVTSLLQDLNQGAERRVGINDLVIKAAALACRKVPEVNSQWHGDAIRHFASVDVCVAVATDGGLITPIVFNADLKGLGEISSDVRELAGKARDGTLQPEEFLGGTFTVSNLGKWGIKQFTAIINPPQACILAVGGARDEFGKKVMSVTLSCDHRVVDGAVGATWLAHFRGLLESPEKLLL